MWQYQTGKFKISNTGFVDKGFFVLLHNIRARKIPITRMSPKKENVDLAIFHGGNHEDFREK